MCSWFWFRYSEFVTRVILATRVRHQQIGWSAVLSHVNARALPVGGDEQSSSNA